MVEVIAVLGPHVLWALLVAWVLWRVGWTTIREVFGRVNVVEVGGVRVRIESGVRNAAAARDVEVPSEERRIIAERLRLAQPRLATMRFLWIDDYPAGIEAEAKVLKALGATIDLACSDAEARKRLDGAVYDIVLSDIKRGQRDDAGIRFLPEVGNAVLAPSVIFYVGESKGTPYGAFGIATRPDELFHLIVDALERQGR